LGLAFRVSLPGLPRHRKNRYGWYQVVLHLLIVDHGCFFSSAGYRSADCRRQAYKLRAAKANVVFSVFGAEPMIESH
jgi:hypothetical protein